MLKNRKSFIYMMIFDRKNDKINFRVFRIKQNKPILIGYPVMENVSAVLYIRGFAKKRILKGIVKSFLIRSGQIKESHIEGEDYLLEAV